MTLRALLFQQRICTSVCAFVSGSVLQSGAAVGLHAAPPSRLANCTCLSLLPPVSHLLVCFSLPLTSPLSYLFSLSVWFSACLGHPSSPFPTPACLHRVSGHASYLLTLTWLQWFIHPLLTAMWFVCSESGWSDHRHTQLEKMKDWDTQKTALHNKSQVYVTLFSLLWQKHN